MNIKSLITNAEKDTHSLANLITAIISMLQNSNFAELDQTVSELTKEDPIISTVTILRVSSTFKEHLPSWKPKVLECKEWVDSMGRDGAKLLIGLL